MRATLLTAAAALMLASASTLQAQEWVYTWTGASATTSNVTAKIKQPSRIFCRTGEIPTVNADSNRV